MMPHRRFDSMAEYWADEFSLPIALLRAQMMRESGGDPNVISTAGAMGLMQIMPGTAKDLGVNPLNPDQALKGGCLYMSQKLKQVGLVTVGMNLDYNDVYRLALASYNCGFGYVKAALQRIRDMGLTFTWPTFIDSLQIVTVGPFKRKADWRQVDGYIRAILPPV